MAEKITLRTPDVPVGQRRTQPRRSALRRREEIAGYIWTSPWWLGFLAFSLYPMLAGLYYSFTNAGWIGPTPWVGLKNYQQALFDDPLFWPSIGRTLYYSGAVVPLTLAAELFAASILNSKLRAQNVFRTIFYIPSLMPAVALVVIWTWILNPKFGLLNQLLGMIGIAGPGWLQSPQWAIPALILMSVWGSFGGAGMLIFLSALQSVPQELYEACDLDGGGARHKFLHITVPAISPAILFNLLMGIIASFQTFLYSFLAPAVPGGPNYATYTISLHMYNQGFREQRMGYAAALAWLVFVLIFVIVVINYKLSGRWVFMAASTEDKE